MNFYPDSKREPVHASLCIMNGCIYMQSALLIPINEMSDVITSFLNPKVCNVESITG